MRKHIFVFYLLLITQLLHAQNVIDLTGEWNFQIDKENKGIDEKWYARPLNDKINLPGSMPEKLKGERPSLQTQWTGRFTTVLSIIIPNWKCSDVQEI